MGGQALSSSCLELRIKQDATRTPSIQRNGTCDGFDSIALPSEINFTHPNEVGYHVP